MAIQEVVSSIPKIRIWSCLLKPSLRIPVSAIWPVISASDLHQTVETSNCHSQILWNTSGDLLGRPFDFAPESCRIKEDFPTGNYTTHQPWFHYQPGEVLTITNTSNCLPGGKSGLQEDDHCSSSRQTPQLTDGVQGHPEETGMFHGGTISIVGSNEPDCQDRDLEGTIVLSSPSTALHRSSAQEWSLHQIQALPNPSDTTGIHRTGVVVIEPTDTTQSNDTNTTTIRHDHIDRCVQERVGCKLHGTKDRWSVDEARGQGPHQCVGTEGSISCNPSSCQEHVIPSTPYPTPHGQHHSSGLHKQTGRDAITIASITSFGDMDILPFTPDLGDSETCCRRDQYRGGFCIEKLQQPNRVDTGQKGLPEDNQEILCTGSRLIRIPDKQPVATLCSKVSRPWVNSDRCLSSELEPMDCVYSCSDSATAKDSPKDPSRSSDRVSDSSDMVGTALVPNLTGVVSGFSSSLANNRRNNISSLRSSSNSSNVENPPTSCMAAVGSRLQTTGLSPEVCKILLASWRASTQKRYEAPWQLWASWCIQRNKCPFSAPVTDVLAFLSEQFNTRNLAYRTLGVYKACISQIHDPVDGQQLGNLPVVSRFMKGIFQLRPTTPRLCCTWSVGPVLRHLSSLEPLEELSLKELSLKLTVLLALTSAARSHEIAALDCDHVSKKADSWEFIIPTHVKNSRPYHPPRKIYLERYKLEPSICVIRCLEHYMTRTNNHRQQQSLLLSYISPYKPVGSQTVARWLCTSLRSAGVDVCYTGHSTRAASTSEAVDGGLPIEVVLGAADWSSVQTFEKHYHKQSDRAQFAHKVLSAINC